MKKLFIIIFYQSKNLTPEIKVLKIWTYYYGRSASEKQ